MKYSFLMLFLSMLIGILNSSYSKGVNIDGNKSLALIKVDSIKEVDTLKFDPYHYNRYVGKIIVYVGEGFPYHGQICSLDPFKRVESMESYENMHSNNKYIIYPSDNSFMTLNDSVVNKEFLCMGIESDGSWIYLKLQNSKIGVVITKYVLGSGIDSSPFRTKVELNANQNIIKTNDKEPLKTKQKFIPCSEIDYQYDDFRYTKKYSTASSYEEQVERPHDLAYEAGEKEETKTSWYNVIFYKDIEKGTSTYYLNLEIPSSSPVHNKGVIIILNNGSRINRPSENVTTRVVKSDNDEPFRIRCFMRLTKADIILLKSSPIKEFELFADQAYSVQPEKVYQMFLCLLSRK